jgi:hypothetical protein
MGHYGTEVQTLATLRQIPEDAIDYRRALENLAKDEKTLADHLRRGSDSTKLAAAWLNEDLAGTVGGTKVYESLGQQRDWMRNSWQNVCATYDAAKLEVANLRTRAAVGSLTGLVAVLAAFLAFGVVAPLAYLSARGGSSRMLLLVAFSVLAFLFLAYLGNEVRRLSNALRLEREFW